MTKLAFIDVETTGLSAWKNGIWQFAMIIQVGEKTEELSLEFAPFEKDLCDKKAVEMSGKSESELRALPDPVQARLKIERLLQQHVDPYNKLDKFTMVAYNARFDYDFLRQWWAKCGDKFFGSYFWFPPICAMELGAFTLRNSRSEYKDFKLGTVAAGLGLELNESSLHDALYDIQLTKEVYETLCLKIKSSV